MATKNVLELIESTYDVGTIVTTDGIPVWPLIRQAVYFKTMQKKVQYSNKLRTRSKLQLLKNFFYGIGNLFKLSRFEYIFFNNTDKRTELGDKMFDIYYDAWADALNADKSLFIEWAIDHHLPKSEVHSKNVVSDLPMKLWAGFHTTFTKVTIRNEELLSQILEEHGIQLNVKKELKAKLGIYKAYRSLFKKAQPKAVFVLSSFTKVGEVMAAKELSIPVYEAQHGYIGHTHPFYHAQKKFPTFYPDYLISFGASEKLEEQSSLIFNSQSIIPVGTLQAIKDETILEWVKSQAETNPTWLFIVRPKQPNTTFELYTKANNVLILPELSTYDVLKACDYNITIFSTTVVEGIYLGASPILFNIDDLPYKYFDLKNSDIAIIKDGEPLSEVHLAKGGTFKTPYFVENYFDNVEKAALCI